MKIGAPVHRALPAPAVEHPRPSRRKPEEGPIELTAKHRAFIDAMVWGVDDERVVAMTRRVKNVVGGKEVVVDRPLEKGEPLELHEAARLIGLRLRNARELFDLPIFHTAYTQEVQRLRDGAKPIAMRRIVELRDRTGNGKAADSKVQLAASQAILGEAVGVRPAHISINNNFSNNTITPGYIIDLGSGEQSNAVDYGSAGSIIDGRNEGR